MIADEIDLIGRLKDVEPLRDEAVERARMVLRAAIAVGEPAVAPARVRRRMLSTRCTIGVGLAAAAAAVTLIATSTTQPAQSSHRPSVGTPAASARVKPPRMRLADYITANDSQPAGDATLVIRATTYPGSQPVMGVDLYTDSGEYFYAASESGLPAEIAGNDNVGDGSFAREVAAAIYAVKGDLATARQRMANASFDPGVEPSGSGQSGLTAAQAREKSMGIKVAPHAATRAGVPGSEHRQLHLGELDRRSLCRRRQPSSPSRCAPPPVNRSRGHGHQHHHRQPTGADPNGRSTRISRELPGGVDDQRSNRHSDRLRRRRPRTDTRRHDYLPGFPSHTVRHCRRQVLTLDTNWMGR
jgi:hypothetical protein